MRKLKPGFSEMTLVPLTVSKVMKSKSIPLVCITDTLTGHPNSPGTHSTLKLLEEVSRFGKEPAKVATELCIRSTISWWTRVSNNTSSSNKWSFSQRSIQLIKRIEEISSRNGTSDKESSTTECGLHI